MTRDEGIKLGREMIGKVGCGYPTRAVCRAFDWEDGVLYLHITTVWEANIMICGKLAYEEVCFPRASQDLMYKYY